MLAGHIALLALPFGFSLGGGVVDSMVSDYVRLVSHWSPHLILVSLLCR